MKKIAYFLAVAAIGVSSVVVQPQAANAQGLGDLAQAALGAWARTQQPYPEYSFPGGYYSQPTGGSLAGQLLNGFLGGSSTIGQSYPYYGNSYGYNPYSNNSGYSPYFNTSSYNPYFNNNYSYNPYGFNNYSGGFSQQPTSLKGYLTQQALNALLNRL